MSEDDQLHITTARGFVRLKQYLDAHESITSVSPEVRDSTEVLSLKVPIFHGLEKWEAMEIVARALANRLPEETNWMAAWIAAKRRVSGDEVADAILADYLPALPSEGSAHYALGKLAWSMSDRKTAEAFLKRAFELTPSLRSRAENDAELAKFWEAS